MRIALNMFFFFKNGGVVRPVNPDGPAQPYIANMETILSSTMLGEVVTNADLQQVLNVSSGAYVIGAAVSINGHFLTISFSENLSVGTGGSDGFSVTPTKSFAMYSMEPTVVTLYFETPIYSTDILSLGYTQPGSGFISVSDNSDISSFSDYPIINSSGANVSDPIIGFDLDDTSTSNNLTASYGAHSATIVNSTSSALHDGTNMLQGTGCFKMAANTSVIIQGVASILNTGIFAVQFSIKAPASSSKKTVRLLDTVTNNQIVLIANNGSSTSLSLYIAGTLISNNITVDDYLTDSWNMFRLVCDHGASVGKIQIFQNSGTVWSLKASFDAMGAMNISNVMGGYLAVYGAYSGNTESWGTTGEFKYSDQMLIWNTANVPPVPH